MYYDLTPAEKQRVEMAAFFGIAVDPVGYGDLAAVVVYALVLCVGFAATVYMWLNRHYAPLKAKNIPLMTGIYLHSVFFFIGDLTLCGLVHVRGPFFANCDLMLIWFRSMFGNFALGSLLTIRSYKLYRIFCQNKPMHGYKRSFPYVLFIVIVLVIGMISSLVPRRMTVIYLEGVEFCVANPNLVTTYCAILWCIWAIYMAMVWLLRNVRSSFNEFMEMAISLLLLVVCTIFNQVVLYYMPRLPTSLRWRLAMVTVDQITANYIWWLIMFKPIVNCIFRHDKYLAEWKHKMALDGLRSQYGVSTGDADLTIHSNTLVYSQVEAEKSVRPEPSYTESTRQAVDRLAAFSDTRQAEAAGGWRDAAHGMVGTHDGLDVPRPSMAAAAREYEHHRHSECSLDAPNSAAGFPDGALPEYRALSQDQAESSAPPRTSGSASRCILEIDAAPLRGPGAPSTIYGRGSLDQHIQRPAPYVAGAHRWQHSDTDLSLASSGCSGGRRLL
ncbi:hypothetical protein H4R18_001119 [Coemansia javaensis]|uniref:G-protein coupled receptors family 3 profile domain-containing protein n=1 Tax=Coemansia javaensis TaxID=2761396 RepID=A0A9W8HKM4_9FUNG|nr:hypothetical protein H4R18_001119 [Coemansia javaensis]